MSSSSQQQQQQQHNRSMMEGQHGQHGHNNNGGQQQSPDANAAAAAYQQQQQQQQQHSQQDQLGSSQQGGYGGGGGGGGGSGGYGRRVTIGGVQGSNINTSNAPGAGGGGGGGAALGAGAGAGAASAASMMMAAGVDRRGSLASTGFNVDDFLTGRRGSLGFDVALDNMLRRDSMDSGGAALDSALLDYTRRRYSMAAMGGPGAGGAGGQNADLFSGASAGGAGGANLPPLQSMGSMGAMGMGMGGAPPQGGGYGGSSGGGAGAGAGGSGSSPGGGGGNPASALAQRQQFLQQQQRELEQRQRELEIQRQQLISSMQDRGPYLPPGQQSSSSGLGGLGASQRGSLDVSARTLDVSGRPLDISGRPLDVSGRGGGHPLDASGRSSIATASTSSQWWICQVCNAKAFASHEEAMGHEETCRRRNDPLNPISLHDGSMQAAGGAGATTGRSYSLGMDSSTHSAYDQQPLNLSTGPFATMDKPNPLAMPSDKDWLTPLHCFVRRHCVEIFTASEQDVATPSKGKRKPITVGQVGIRCPHCHHDDPAGQPTSRGRERGSVYYPTTIASIYNATMNLLQRHLHSCTAVPDDIMRRYETLKADDARSGTSKRYWIESALSLGLVDTAMGIRFSARTPPPLPTLTTSQETEGHTGAVRRNSNDFFSTNSNAVTEMPEESEQSKASIASRTPAMESVSKSEQDMATSAPLVEPEDKPYSTSFSYHLLSQMQPCVFTEADRLGKRKGLPPGFPGLACRHCFGGYGSGRFFPSSIKTLSDTSKTLNVLHNHMMRCRKCPAEVRESLERLRGTHDEERAKMKFGSQKAFFARIWDRLHGKDAPPAHNHHQAHQAQQQAHHQQQQQMHQQQQQQQQQHPKSPALKRKAVASPHQSAMKQQPVARPSGAGGGDASTKMSPGMPPQTAGPPATTGLDTLARQATSSEPKRQKTN